METFVAPGDPAEAELALDPDLCFATSGATHPIPTPLAVIPRIPAKAGISILRKLSLYWIPAFAGNSTELVAEQRRFLLARE